MKKIYTLIASMALASGVFAQSTVQGGWMQLNVPVNGPKQKFHPTPSVNGGTSKFYIDYDYAESNMYPPPSDYGWYIWSINTNYDTTAGDKAQGIFKYAVAGFDSLYDPYAMVAIPNNAVKSLTVDSIWMNVGHKRTSGTNDTIRVSIIPLNSAGYPNNLNSILWTQDRILTTNLSSNNNWLVDTAIYFAPNFTSTSIQRFGVKLEYFGAKQDTFGILCGFHKNNAQCGTGSFSAARSDFWMNSFTRWMAFYQYTLLPLSNGVDLFYDCNGDNAYTFGTDGESYIQNISIWVHVTVIDNVSVSENEAAGIKLYQNTPNPSAKSTSISYDLSKAGEVTFEIYDIAGKLISSINEGNKGTGKHKISIDTSVYPSGTYFYTLKTEGTTLTRKMVIAE